MRVLMVSKACIVGQYQTKLEALARKPDIELTVVVPSYWRDERGIMPLEMQHTDGYHMIIAPLYLNGHYHLHFYPTFRSILARIQPDIVHLDEEPYNFATFHALYVLKKYRARARTLFFTWQNLTRTYPPPFAWMEKYVYAKSDTGLAGSEKARDVLRAKRFAKPIYVIPQFGVVPDVWLSAPTPRANTRPPVIGFAGRLVAEKGTDLLLRALARVEVKWELRILGSGPLRKSLAELATALGIAERVHFDSALPSGEMPDYFRSLDLFVLPSVSRSNWKEQFGRVLIEAMASGVPVIGSSSGEIPNVIGDAGVIFPEGNIAALAEQLRALLHDPARRAELGARGRTRVLEKFTQEKIVDDTYAVYRELMQSSLTQAKQED
jgi:glycosyltransferase involved in cell wall biosynthesis